MNASGGQLYLNGKPFTKNARMKEGNSLHMELQRAGFETIRAEVQKLTFEHDGKPFVFPKKDLKWEKSICTRAYDLRYENGELLTNRAKI